MTDGENLARRAGTQGEPSCVYSFVDRLDIGFSRKAKYKDAFGSDCARVTLRALLSQPGIRL